MPDAKTCPGCGQPFTGEGLRGLCPRCLGNMAFAFDDEPEAAAGPPDLPGPSKLRYFGDYELLEEIARGGMGVVFKARQVSLNRIVAVKMLLSGQFAQKEFVERFRAEARAAAALQHPNIVAIHEIGEHEEQQYFSMDYVEGQDLARLVGDKPLPARRGAAYLKTIAEAVHYAHQRGVIHRDLKPSNVLLDAADQPRVTDFGLAKRLGGSRDESRGSRASDALASSGSRLSAFDSRLDLTLTGQILGTPGYMPPEQAAGKRSEISIASDVYSLGAILFFVLTGRPPFQAETVEATLRQVTDIEPVSPRLLNPSVPRDLETICLKCLGKEPRRRYDSAQTLADDLQRWLHHEPIQARPVRPAERLWRWCRRKPALATAIAALHLVGATGLMGIVWEWRRAERHAARETAQRVRAQEAVTMLELQRAEDLLEKDEVVMGVAYLSRMVRQQPTNQIAARRLLSALTQRNFALPAATLLQHGKKVNYAEFSPDGRRVVTASSDLTARTWDAYTGAAVGSPMLHSNAVAFAGFSPDGKDLLTFTGGPDVGSSEGCYAQLWEAATGRALGEPMRHAKRIYNAQFNPTGDRVLTASGDGSARVWDAQTGRPALQPLAHKGIVRSARFNADGSRIVTACEDGTAQVWNAQTGRPVAKPFRHSGRVDGAEFSPDGKWVLTMTWGHTWIWDVASGDLLGKPLELSAEIAAAKFSPDGQRVVTSLHNGETRLWNARDWTPLTPLMQHRGWTAATELGPEDQRILTGSLDNTARLWDAVSGQALTGPMQHDGLVWSARLSPDGLFAVTASADKTARIWDVRLSSVRCAAMRHSIRLGVAEFSPDGEWILTRSDGGSARIWNARTGPPEGRTLAAEAGKLARFSPEGKQVVTGSENGTVRIWDTRTGEPLTPPMLHSNPVQAVAFSPDGRLLATADSSTPTIRLWDAQSGEQQGQPLPNQSHANALAFSPDGRFLLATRFRDDGVNLWDLNTRSVAVEFMGHEGWVMECQFSPDGQRVLTASEDGTARIWNVHTGQPLTPPLRHKSLVPCARFSRDGQWVATASDDGTAQVWDARSGQPAGEPMRHRGEVKTAEFSPDALLVVTASFDGTARMWDARTGRPVAEPFEHHGKVVSAHFSPDGRRVLTASDEARLWDVPPTVPLLNPRSSRREEAHSLRGNDQSLLTSAATVREDNSPGILLADLAEAVIGKRVTERGALEVVSSARLGEVRQKVARLPRDADFTRWLEWFFADRDTRTISPYSAVSLPQYIQARAEETNVISWREALMLCPTNGIAFAQMAGHHLRQNAAPAPLDVARADWASRQAVKFAPERSQPWQRRIEVMEHTGGWTQLMAEAEQVIHSQPTNAYAWISKSRCLDELGQFEAVVPAATAAWELRNREPSYQAGLAHVLQADFVADPARLIEEAGSIHAMEIFEQEVTRQPYNAVFWNAKGLLHEKAAEIQQAEASFAKALAVASLPAVSWDFESGRTSPNWNPMHQMANIMVERGNLSFDSTGEDPYLELSLPPVDGTPHRWFHVRMKNATSGDRAQVYWGTVADPEFHEARAVQFPILPNDRQFTVYTVDMGHQAWTKNRIVHLRFDPVTRPGHVDIDWICLHTNSKPPAEVSGWREIADPEMRRLALSNLERLRRR